MKHGLITFLLSALSVLPPTQAQGPKPPEPETIDSEDTSVEDKKPKVPLPIPPEPENQVAKEILDLFQKVDKSLGAIDNMLFDLGAGERPVEAPKDSGLGELLELTRAASDAVVQDIDRILELAETMSSQQQSGSSGSGQQQSQPSKSKGQQPKDGQDQESPQSEREDKKNAGQEPKPKSPESDKKSDQEGQNKTSDADRKHPTGAGSQAHRAERWGELPLRVRKAFRNQGGESAPLYYRDWINSYYRHLSEGDG